MPPPSPSLSVMEMFYRMLFRFSMSGKDNHTMPNLVQVVTASKSYRNKVAPVPVGSTGPRAPVSLNDAPKEPEPEDEFVKATRETLMGATIDGLINKALISALFLNFNIPSIMVPPVAFDTEDATYLIFFLAAGFAIACGFYCILTGVFMATTARAATVTQSMALVFSEQMAPHMFWNHNIFMLQGLLTSVQVAAVCVSYSENHWSLWMAIGACCLSLLGVSITKIATNKAWLDSLAAGDEIIEAEEAAARASAARGGSEADEDLVKGQS